MTKQRVFLIAVVLLATLGALVFVARDVLAGVAVRAAVASFGYRFDAERMHLTPSSLTAIFPVVRNHAGEPVFSAQRIDVGFSLRDLLPGSQRRFGLTAVDVEQPQLTLTHHPDGTYNVVLPSGGTPSRPDNTPLDVHVRVRRGTVTLIDRYVVPGQERRESLTGLAVDAVLAPRDPAYYRVSASLRDGTQAYPLEGRGRFDHARGVTSQRWSAAQLPIGPLIDFALSTHAVRLVDGRLHHVEAEIYGFIQPDGSTDTHLGGSAQLAGGKVFVAKLAAPIRDAHGPLRVYDTGLTTTGIDATLAHVPLHLVGGVGDAGGPKLRFLVTGAGTLARLRTLAPQIARRPIDGRLAFALRADGTLAAPVVRGWLSAPTVSYGAYALHDFSGALLVSGQTVQIAALGARYGPIVLRGGGTVVLGGHLVSNVVANFEGPADALPYAGAIVPNARMRGLVVLQGTDGNVSAAGTVTARGGGSQLDAPFTLTADGTGTLGPLALTRRDGASLYARLTFDRSHDAVAGIVRAQRLALLPAPAARLPNFAGLAPPPISGTLDADLVGTLHGASLASAAGTLRVRRAGFAGIPIGDLDARLADRDGLALDDVRLRGPFGALRGAGAYANGMLAAQGTFRGSFDRLAPILHGLRARGRIDADLRVVARPGNITAQIVSARFRDANIQGIALRGAAATIGLRHDAVDVHAARLDLPGGTIVARGSFGNGGTLLLSMNGNASEALHAAGLPLAGGSIVSIASLSGTPSAPRVRAVAALGGGRLDGTPLDALVAARYAGGRIQLDHAQAIYAGANANATGKVEGIAPGDARAPRIDVTASVRGADVATLTRELRLPLRHPDAAVDADVRVHGAATDPGVQGNARIAAGSINGLGFRDVIVPLAGSTRNVAVRGGTATVGSTTLRFDAATSGGIAHAALHADRADLADFNDYFDAADTLDGQGRLDATLALGANTLATGGAVVLRDARFRRYALGDLDARWSTRGHTLAAHARLGGAHGTLRADGTAQLPAQAPLAHIAASVLNVNASLTGLDLGTWLPAAGIAAPVIGRVDASAQAHGGMRDLALNAQAALHDGMVGRIPVRTLTFAGTYGHGAGRIAAARLEALNVVATANGTFGIAAEAPLGLTLHASSPDVGALALGVTGQPFDGAGAFEGTLQVTGSRRAPVLALVADIAHPRYQKLQATDAHADLAYANGRVTARNVALVLPAGRLSLSGSAPAALHPPFVGDRNAPLSAELVANGIQLAQFAPLLTQGTKLGGVVNGDLSLSGTLQAPELRGNASLAQGSYASSFLASPVNDATFQIALAGKTATVQTLHAQIGGGAIDGSGAATLVSGLAFHLDTRVQHVGLDVPRFFRGKVDGTLSLHRDVGAPVVVGGDLAFSHTRIPLSALLPSKNAAPASAPPLPVAFALRVAATNDDRIQGPSVDVAAQGSATLGGTLAKPTLDGTFTSNSGQINVYRVFTLQRARVAFDPSAGIIPDVEATATTHVPDPPTDVLLHVHGPATQLSLDLASQPPYDKAQIIGLLANAQALGAVSGVAQTSGKPASTSSLAQGVALGYVDQQFTRNLFEPFSSTVGKSLGFSSFNVNVGLTGGYSASATRALSENLSVSFAQSYLPQTGQRQSYTLAYNLSDAAALKLTLFDAGTGPTTVGVQAPVAPSGPTNWELQTFAPPPGSNGYIFTYVRRIR